MAYVGGGTSTEEEEAKKGQAGANPLADQAPVTTSSAPGAGPGAAPSSAATGAVASNQATPQPFTNLKAYLTANEPQIQGMGQKIAGEINEGYGKVQNDITSGTQGFQGQVKGGYAAPNEELVKQATSHPTDFISDPNNVTAFQKQLNNQYVGPSNFESSDYYANLNKEVQDAATKANQVNTPSGLQSYLTGLGNNPTAGDRTLDQVLLYGNPEALSTIKGAADKATALPDYLSSVIPGQNQAVSDAQASASSSRDAARAGLTKAGTDFNSDLQKRLDEAQGNYTTYNKDVGQIRGAAQDINSQIQAYLAQNPQLSLDRGNNYLAPWMNLSEATNAPTLQNVSGQNDYATNAALAQLAGESGLYNSPLDQSAASQAGTFGLPLDLQGAISNQEIPAAMMREVQSLSNQIQGAYSPLQKAQEDAARKATELQPLQDRAQKLSRNIQSKQFVDAGGNNIATPEQISQMEQELAQVNGKIQELNQLGGWESVGPIAQNLQWLTGASTGYNDLVGKLQADLQGLSKMDVPQSKAPSLPGKTTEQQAGNAASTAIGAGIPAATATGLLAGSAPLTASELAASGATVAGEVPAAGLTGAQTLGPAALAAYGTSNIAQNAAKNPVESGLSTLANTGLSLATLSLPPKILDQLGGKLKGILNSITDFFGGLF